MSQDTAHGIAPPESDVERVAFDGLAWLDEVRDLVIRRNARFAMDDQLLMLDVIAAGERRRQAHLRSLECFRDGDYSHGGYEARDAAFAALGDEDAALEALWAQVRQNP